MTLQRSALVTDAWHPQTKAVDSTRSRRVHTSKATPAVVHRGVEFELHAGRGPCPRYSRARRHRGRASHVPTSVLCEIRLAMDPWRAVRRLRSFDPRAIHIATEGPPGLRSVPLSAAISCASTPAPISAFMISVLMRISRCSAANAQPDISRFTELLSRFASPHERGHDVTRRHRGFDETPPLCHG